jgi:hypothetical protein
LKPNDVFGPRLLHALAVTALIVGCAGGYRVQSSIGADGTVIDRMVDNAIALEGEGQYSDYAIPGVDMDLVGIEQSCFLNASRHRAPDGSLTYYLLFSYTGPQRLNIGHRRSLELVIDRKYSIVLVGQGEVARDQDKMNKTFTESFEYLIPVETLVMLSRADEANVIVTGEFELRGYFDGGNFSNYVKFVENYVDWHE